MARGDVTRSSYSSTEERSAEEVVVDVGDKAGDCTMSCRKEGRSGAGAWTVTWGVVKWVILWAAATVVVVALLWILLLP